jgi:hypothetical protein
MFSFRYPAVLFFISCSATPRDEVLFIILRLVPSLISVFPLRILAILTFAWQGRGKKSRLLARAPGEVLFIKLRPAPAIMSVFSSCDPALLLLEFRSAPPWDEVLFIKLRSEPFLINVFFVPRPPQF